MVGFSLAHQHVTWNLSDNQDSVIQSSGTIDIVPCGSVRGTIDDPFLWGNAFSESPERKNIVGKLDDGRTVLIPDAVIKFSNVQARICFISQEEVGLDLRDCDNILIKKASVRICGTQSILTYKHSDLRSFIARRRIWYKKDQNDECLLEYVFKDRCTSVEIPGVMKEGRPSFREEDVRICFKYPEGIDYIQLMNMSVVPLQSFVSILSQRIESVLGVDVMLSLDGREFLCSVYGGFIVGASEVRCLSSAIKQLGPLDFLEKFSVWKHKFDDPSSLFRVCLL
ncbi:hypothetical protein [Bifidobacterium samirii]|uniref:Uncharacterized protein n=1 Tax=Bifidobacterium samirii TaxID=2306974 RepID=A0A430FV95_9BIFI|nr:hypothetical protein [Bifidobacterium samirii]RSX57695.1 hypothetical protein D2E24_0543 [Bifidobacterium samirii]